jgi:DNA invertase Pin-like site-specific DNA recombinase
MGIKSHSDGVQDVEKFIGYVRVSTKSQGESGLGLEAQNRDIGAHMERTRGTLIKTYREVESGKNNNRPELQKALMHARRANATLIVAKLDRLSRNVLFLAQLQESKVKFVCCDMPEATELTIHIYAAIAQWERKRISERTKDGLAMSDKTKESTKPGYWDKKINCPECHNDKDKKAACIACHGSGKTDRTRREAQLAGSRKALARSVKTRQENARKLHAELCPVVLAYRDEGMTLEEIADRLNKDSIFTARGKEWNAVYVHRFLKLCETAA